MARLFLTQLELRRQHLLFEGGVQAFRNQIVEIAGADVSESNFANSIYLKGNAITEASIRLAPADEHIGVPHIEIREDGIWRNTSLALSSETLFLGNDVSLSSVGSHLQVNSVESGGKSLLLEVKFDDAGTALPHTHVLGPLLPRVVFSSNEIGEIITDEFVLEVASFITAFRYRYYFKTGSVAATEPVTMTLTKGHAPGGTLVFTQTMPASQWPAESEVLIELDGALSLSAGAPLLLTIDSAANFSLRGDEANGGNFFAMDFQLFSLEDVISIPTGTDRYLCDNGAEGLFDNAGNPMLFGDHGSLDTTTPAPLFPPMSDPPPPAA